MVYSSSVLIGAQNAERNANYCAWTVLAAYPIGWNCDWQGGFLMEDVIGSTAALRPHCSDITASRLSHRRSKAAEEMGQGVGASRTEEERTLRQTQSPRAPALLRAVVIDKPILHKTSERYNSDAILNAIVRIKPAPFYPARVFCHVKLRENPAKCLETVRDNLSNPRDKHPCLWRQGAKSHQKSPCKSHVWIELTLSLPWVINFIFPLQPHQKYDTTQVWRIWLLVAFSDERWFMLPILTTSLNIHLSMESCKNVIFELGSERINAQVPAVRGPDHVRWSPHIRSWSWKLHIPHESVQRQRIQSSISRVGVPSHSVPLVHPVWPSRTDGQWRRARDAAHHVQCHAHYEPWWPHQISFYWGRVSRKTFDWSDETRGHTNDENIPDSRGFVRFSWEEGPEPNFSAFQAGTGPFV